MFVSELRIFQFRNLEDTTITLPEGPVALVGNNGNGKTNVIEAVTFLGQGKSFRTNINGDVIRIGAGEASVFGKVKSREFQEVELGVSLQGRKRSGYVNSNKVASFAEYVGHLVCVTFSPNDLGLVQGAPAERRSFVDRHLVDIDPAILRPLVQYQKALANKNAVLRSSDASRQDIEPWNRLLADAAIPIVKKRKELTESLLRKTNEIHAAYAGVDGAVSLAWKASFDEEVAANTDTVFEFLMGKAEREIAAGSSLYGPHRDDLIIGLGGREARSFASQGQCRSLVLSLKFAIIDLVEEARGESPVVLLDDVDSELDSERSTRLFSTLFSKQRQVLVSGTQEPRSEIAFQASFTIRDGRIFEGSGRSEKSLECVGS